MTELKAGVSKQIRELGVEQLQAATGGSAATSLGVSLLDIHGFNPQPDPPAMPLGVIAFGH